VWLRSLAKVVAEIGERWSLTIGPPFLDDAGSCSWVAPVLANGSHAVLKIALPHMEGADEIAGLRFWNGDHIVRLLDADASVGAMPLERCRPGTSLRTEAGSEQDRVVAELLRHLWRPPSSERTFRNAASLQLPWANAERAGRNHRWLR
jgi:streptomycin 6-kinase